MRGNPRRCQAENPLISLFRFPEPALCEFSRLQPVGRVEKSIGSGRSIVLDPAPSKWRSCGCAASRWRRFGSPSADAPPETARGLLVAYIFSSGATFVVKGRTVVVFDDLPGYFAAVVPADRKASIRDAASGGTPSVRVPEE